MHRRFWWLWLPLALIVAPPTAFLLALEHAHWTTYFWARDRIHVQGQNNSTGAIRLVAIATSEERQLLHDLQISAGGWFFSYIRFTRPVGELTLIWRGPDHTERSANLSLERTPLHDGLRFPSCRFRMAVLEATLTTGACEPVALTAAEHPAMVGRENSYLDSRF